MSAASTAIKQQALQTQAGTEQYLTFLLAGEEYGVDILRVQEIKGWEKVTRVPHTPNFVLGVINLRGAIVPVIDLRTRFALDNIPYGPTTVVIVVRVAGERGDRTVGIVVDAVSEVYNVPSSDRRPPPDMLGPVDRVLIKGLVRVDEKMVILLDVDRLINSSVLIDTVPAERS